MRPFVIGHAAAAGEAPPNTLAGVRAALDAGAEAMEIDVLLSADGVPVLIHDTVLDRCTNLSGNVRDFTSEQLARADAGGGEGIPTLAEVLRLVNGRLTVMCELKATPGEPGWDDRLVDAALSVIDAGHAIPWSAVHSFNPAMLARARGADPRISGAMISPPVSGDDLDRLMIGTLKRGGQAISVEHHSVTPELVVAAKRRQLCVWAWTADSPADWQRLVDAGADGIITNYPHRLRAFLAPPSG